MIAFCEFCRLKTSSLAMRAFSSDSLLNSCSRCDATCESFSSDGYCTSRMNSSCAMVSRRPVLPGCPETKIRSPSFTPVGDHFK